jgi:hypothetical protein
LVAERGVSTRQTPGDRVAEAQGIPRDMEGVEAMVVESPWWSLHSRSFRLETASRCAEKNRIISITCEMGIDRSI